MERHNKKKERENYREKQVNLIRHIKKSQDSKSINQTIPQLSSPRPKSNFRIKNNPFVIYLLQNTKRHTPCMLISIQGIETRSFKNIPKIH